MVAYRNPGPLEFDAVIERADLIGSSAFVPFPFDTKEQFGTAGRVPVTVRFDNIDYRGSLVTYGGSHLILVLTDIQNRLGKGPGDSVRVRIELDTAERMVELDDDIAQALTDAGALASFRGMSYSHQREYALWIAEAKRSETRQRRIVKMIELVAEGLRLK